MLKTTSYVISFYIFLYPISSHFIISIPSCPILPTTLVSTLRLSVAPLSKQFQTPPSKLSLSISSYIHPIPFDPIRPPCPTSPVSTLSSRLVGCSLLKTIHAVVSRWYPSSLFLTSNSITCSIFSKSSDFPSHFIPSLPHSTLSYLAYILNLYSKLVRGSLKACHTVILKWYSLPVYLSYIPSYSILSS